LPRLSDCLDQARINEILTSSIDLSIGHAIFFWLTRSRQVIRNVSFRSVIPDHNHKTADTRFTGNDVCITLPVPTMQGERVNRKNRRRRCTAGSRHVRSVQAALSGRVGRTAGSSSAWKTAASITFRTCSVADEDGTTAKASIMYGITECRRPEDNLRGDKKLSEGVINSLPGILFF
jgi:hypothetical protein